jgi:hypothetical protein
MFDNINLVLTLGSRQQEPEPGAALGLSQHLIPQWGSGGIGIFTMQETF